MKRRTFLKQTAAASVTMPFVLNGQPLNAITRHALCQHIQQDTDRVMVLIQLNGGNDGLNTVLPLDHYDRLATVRENILIPESSGLKLTQETALHPAMTGMKAMYEEGKLCLIQNVGYPDQNRSHFRSLDIWQTGSAANEVISTGWLGRYFDHFVYDFPEGYPNAQYPDPFALTIGNIVSETCQGFAANYSMAIQDPFALSPLLEDQDDAWDPAHCYGRELHFVRTSIYQTNAYATVITAAAEKGANLIDYPEANQLAQQLKTIARLIAGGLKTRIYVANIGGFDTHANQVLEGEPTEGAHANLLEQLSEAIGVFQQDLTAMQLDQRVVGMTFSEFGRRIRSNGANGTDHGSAAPLFVFGSCVHPGILGANPVIQEEVEIQEGVAMEYDFRSIYGSLLHQWFGVPVEEVKSLLFEGFSELPVIEGCATTPVWQPVEEEELFRCFPNPFVDHMQVQFSSRGERTRLSLFNAAGYEVKVLHDGLLVEGTHAMDIRGDGLPAGNYFIHLRTPTRQATLSVVRLR
jgi:uncharacterized protein (DUF1501 family)